MRSRRVRIYGIAVLAAALVGAAAWALAGGERPRTDLGLMTTLPLYWQESEGIGEALDTRSAPHWARTALEQDFRLVPLDTLDRRSLAPLHQLLLAQPRALSGEENVALDDWVRGGGRVLLFADPMLTAQSRFPIGDRRRPQDVILLSPILHRWGLDLRFDEDQPPGERNVAGIPVELAGTFAAVPPAGGAPARCTIVAAGLLADCAIGRGHALVVADAALLDPQRGSGAGRAALASLVTRAFAE